MALQHAGIADKGDQALIQKTGGQRRSKFKQRHIVGELRVQRKARRAPRTATAERNFLRVAGVEETLAQAVLVGDLVVGVYQCVILGELPRDAVGRKSKCRARRGFVWRGNKIPAGAVLEAEQRKRYRVNIRTVAGYLGATIGCGLVAKDAADGRGGAIVGECRQGIAGERI